MTEQTRPFVPGDFFSRHQTIKGLRDLADFLEANPGVPVDEYGWTITHHQGISRDTETDQKQRAEVDRIAELLAVSVLDETGRGGHYRARRAFSRITYQALHIPARHMTEHVARDSYRANITLDQVA